MHANQAPLPVIWRHSRSSAFPRALDAVRECSQSTHPTHRWVRKPGSPLEEHFGQQAPAAQLTGAQAPAGELIGHRSPRPRIRRRGARFGDGLETDSLNGRLGGREATRCAVRPLRGAGEPSLLAPRLDGVYTGSPTRAGAGVRDSSRGGEGGACERTPRRESSQKS